MPLVDIQALTYTYPASAAPALREIVLQIEPGELVAIVGANGAGKSTLCYALTGLIPHFFHGVLDGQVRLAGLDTRTQSLGTLVRQAAIVLQNPRSQLSGVRYTVLEEIAFGLENLGVPPAEIAERAKRAMEQMGLAGLEDRSPYSLSGGQQQRLALASVLAMSPQVFVLDEPTSMLDPTGCREVFEAAAALSRQGAAVVIAEHRLEWIAEHATRVVALTHGRIILDGPPRAVLASPKMLEAGIGWTRYTHAAAQARSRGGWPEARPLPVTLAEAVDGFAGRV